MPKSFEIDLVRWVNDKFYDLLFNKERYLVLYGSAGSGKSHFAAQKILLRIMKAMREGYRERFICLRKTGPAARKSIFALFTDYLNKWEMRPYVSINRTDMTFDFEGGSSIYCGSLDDPEKIKSIEGLTSAWLEEPNEFAEEDFTQLDLRIRGESPSYKQIILTFNPISKMIWLFKRFFETVEPDAFVHHSTYLDNRFIDAKYKDILEGLKKKMRTSTWSTLKEYGASLRILFIRTGKSLTGFPTSTMNDFTGSTSDSTIPRWSWSSGAGTSGYTSGNYSIAAA